MKQLLTALRNAPKRYGLLAALAGAVVVPAALLAWGPERATFTVANPAPYVTFNSITDNPIDGDERNFVRASDAAATAASAWKDDLAVQPGKEYLVRMVVHNNAADHLNLKALNTRVKAAVPTTTGKQVQVSGFVSADNAKPAEVWDDVTFTSDKNFNLAYVAGSARIYNNGYAAGGTGKTLPDSIVTSTGAKVGYAAEGDGIVPGCFKYLSYVEFKVKPQFEVTPNFDVQKTVRVNGATDTTFKENVSVKPGDKVDFQIAFTNTGETNLANVAIRDSLPAGLTYVPNSTWLHNSSGTRQVADGVTSAGGIGIGGYNSKANAYVKFTATVATNAQLPTCGPNVLTNVASVDTDSGSKSDQATVNVTKECQTTEKSSFVCTGLEKISKGNNTYDFKATASTQGNVTIKEVKYNFGDNTNAVVNYGALATHKYTTPGTYKITAHITYVMDGKTVTDNNEKCTTTVTVPTTPVTPETPASTPEVLPSTGPAALIGGLFGSSALGLGVHSWLSSRRAVRSALRR